jgi:hypothetical protein
VTADVVGNDGSVLVFPLIARLGLYITVVVSGPPPKTKALAFMLHFLAESRPLVAVCLLSTGCCEETR